MAARRRQTTYFYLRGRATVWPLNEQPPALIRGTANTLLLLASLWPNYLAKRAAERLDRNAVRLWLAVCLLASVVFLGLRVLGRCRPDGGGISVVVRAIDGRAARDQHGTTSRKSLVSGSIDRRRQGAALASLFTTMMHTGALGALMTLSPLLWYYAATSAAYGLDPLVDQQLGGLIMWIPASATYIAVGLAIAARGLRSRPAMRHPSADRRPPAFLQRSWSASSIVGTSIRWVERGNAC